MKAKAYLFAYRQGEIREIEFPDGEVSELALVERAFTFGQNDFQPKNQPSVSVGDVIELENGHYFFVKATGVAPISKGQFNEFLEDAKADPQGSGTLRISEGYGFDLTGRAAK